MKPFAVILLFLLPVLAFVARAEPDVPAGPELWFSVGEELVYDLHWGVIPVGRSQVTTEWIEEDGKRRIAIRIKTRTNKVLSKIYPVDDFLESIINPDGFLPIRFTKRLKEGRYRCDEVTYFDHAGGVAHYTSHLSGKKKDFEIEPDTRDIVSLMYYLRSKQFEPGTTNHYRLMADEKLYDLWVKAQKVEPVSLGGSYGRVESLKFEPEAAFGGIFVRKGKMWMWVSQDPRRLCTRIVARVPVASVGIVLAEVRGPGDDRWVRGKKGSQEPESEQEP